MSLILNSPYVEPTRHWVHKPGTVSLSEAEGRRAPGYTKFSTKSRGDGEFVPLGAVEVIRGKVKAWREAGWPGVTPVTRRLLERWNGVGDEEGVMEPRPFFCQLEAIETLIWMTEGAEVDRQGLWGEFDDQLRGDGGPFERVCTKLCTGGGKTKVMAMLIAWHACNKANYPQDKRFCRDFLIVAPNLTVRDRLAGLDPTNGGEYGGYLVPDELAGALSQAHVRILNWQAMQWDDEKKLAKKKTVDKRGPLSDKAYAKQVLGPELAKAPRILVLNDEAHHAWRLPPTAKAGDYKGVGEEKDEHTVWVGGLDRIHRVVPILRCHDFSATPFIPSGKMSKEDFLFGWIVSDFGLNDGIEAGLVKTPRMPYNAAGAINPETGLPELYDLYEAKGIKEAIAEDVDVATPLPPTLANAYSLLAEDWRRTADQWAERHVATPPVLISVVNNTVTAERIERHFRSGGNATLGQAQELCDEARLLRIDSKVIEKAGAAGDALRERVATVGKVGKPGADVTNLISVAMLSEGWDARTVTHILGLRAFTSQLLCEQVIGRGLRRVSYDVDEETGLLQPEYVQVFGVPFRFLPSEGDTSGDPPKPTYPIAVAPGREDAEITWPNIVRIDTNQVHELSIEDIPELTLAPNLTLSAQLAQTLGEWMKVGQDDLYTLDIAQAPRLQTILFSMAKALLESAPLEEIRKKMSTPRLFAALVRLAEDFIASEKCHWEDNLFWQKVDLKTPEERLAYAYQMGSVVQHLLKHLASKDNLVLSIVRDSRLPTLSTAKMRTWHTTKEPKLTGPKSQIGAAVYDSAWEQSVAETLAGMDAVQAYVRNDRHVGLRVRYVSQGLTRLYIPDFIVRLTTGETVVLEVKGQDDRTAKDKHEALERWCKAVTALHDFGPWRAARVMSANAIALHEALGV